MFNSITYKTENHDLEIASKRRYESQINRLESEVRAGCTPDQLAKAERIAQEFRGKLVFKYISAENSLLNFAVWKSKSNSCIDEVQVSFELNGQQITIPINGCDRILRSHSSPVNRINNIKEAIAKQMVQSLMPVILPKVIERIEIRGRNKK